MNTYTPHLGTTSLIDACTQPGCPICGVGNTSIDTYLQMVLAAYVDAPDLRQQLCDSWGYCHKHAWRLSTVERGNVLTIAIMYSDILEREAKKALEQVKVKKKNGGLLTRLLKSKKPTQPNRHIAFRDHCPACELQEGIETNAINIVLKALSQQNDQMRAALQQSDGLCIPHLNHALELAHQQDVCDILLALAQEKLAAIQAELSEFLRKNDYRFQHEPIGEEKQSWRRALNLIVGAE